jgi:hypothetical protein
MPDFELNFNEDDYSIIATAQGNNNFGSDPTLYDSGDYIRVSILDQNSNIITLTDGSSAVFYSGSTNPTITIPGTVNTYTAITPNQFDSYYSGTDLYIKPNEILLSSAVPTGNYKLQVDFLNQYRPSTDGSEDEFVVKQISPSRLEVRLKLFSTSIATPIDDFLTHLGDPYQFNHILYIGEGRNIPIVNYTFDKFTDGSDNQSIILKLYEPLPSSVRKLDVVTVEREVLITQTQDVYYMSSVTGKVGGTGLDIDNSDSWTNQQGSSEITWQNYTDLVTSASVDSTTINSLITGSSYDYPNLNIDYNSFENHTFFGSAVKKLENFKTKVSTIEDYYSNISSSLSADGGAIDGDSTYVKNRRKKLFNDIQNELNSFTPYEKFLYYDGQSQTTQSAPSLGNNYADSFPMSNGIIDNNSWIDGGIVTGDNPNGEELTNHDGFNIVYKSTDVGVPTGEVGLFKGKYFAHEKPFFNYSGSVYLSFLLKGTTDINVRESNNNKYVFSNGLSVPIPADALYRNFIQDPTPAVDEYKRWIIQASQSYWIPNKGSQDFDELVTGDFDADSTTVTILQSNVKTGSYQISDTTGKYPVTVVSQSNGVPFYGACMPAGDLFKVWYMTGGSDAKKAYVTDVKVTFNDPTDTLPFAQVPKTDSSTWTDWYNTIYSQAETFDDTNIHSLNNNIPTYIQESSEYDDLKTFLNMNGEHYDLIRNHIDNYTSIYNRGYNELDSVPKNLMPILADNLGWELITPFTGSLSGIFGSSVSSTTTTDDIRHNTWRKSLNNLIYLYKSKGTINAVRTLLNIYGYPPDVIGISEFGGSSEEQVETLGISTINPHYPIKDNFDALKGGLNTVRGNVSFVLRQKTLYNYMFSNNSSRILNMDWWMNNANAETVEFVYKHKASTTDQEILKSSGSGAQTLWDLRVQESASLYNFEFRLNNSRTGSSTIASNAVSMSTSYGSIGEGSLWNVMLQRMSSSISGSGTQGYKLATAFQDKDKITILNATSMSVSGGLARDTNYNANENWQSSGSRHYLSSSNLVVGRTLSGSLAEFRTWTSALSASKLKQHVLNKFSTVGNSISSHKDELIYHYRLNENWTTSSLNPKIKDGNPNGPVSNPTNYDISLSTDLLTGSPLYGHDTIDTYALTLRTNSSNQEDNNKILINPQRTLSGHNLNPFRASVLPLSDTSKGQAKRVNSSKLEITNSPTNFINDFIINNIPDADILKSYSKPNDRYASSYTELDTFRDDFFGNYNITVDTNKFIRAHENIWNQSVIEAIKKVVPARSTLSDSSVGVTIKSHLLEHQKVEHEKQKIQYGETGLFSSELTGKTADLSDTIDIKSRIDILETYEAPKDGLIDINEKTSLSKSTYEPSKDTEININELITKTSTYEASKDIEININELITKTSTYEASKDSEISIDTLITKTATYEATKDTEISIDTLITETVTYEASKDSEIGIDSVITETVTYEASKDSEIDGLLTITETMENGVTKDVEFSPLPVFNSEYIPTKNSNDVDYHSTHWIQPFRNLHNEWGTGDTDTHFLNMASDDSGSLGDYNVGHIDDRFVFRMIGDIEVMSGSLSFSGHSPGFQFDFNNPKNFLNREIRDKGKGYTYNSYINGNPGPQDGRPVGKTSYYTSSADGQLLLPVNHWSKFDRPFTDKMYAGTQTTNPGFFNVEHEDYSSASFYRVIVTGGEAEIVVKGKGQSRIGGDDKIVY